MGQTFDMFQMDIGLTEKGENEYMNVLKTVYMFINEIKSEGVQDYIFDELKHKNQLEFNNEKKMSPMETANDLSRKLNWNLKKDDI